MCYLCRLSPPTQYVFCPPADARAACIFHLLSHSTAPCKAPPDACPLSKDEMTYLKNRQKYISIIHELMMRCRRALTDVGWEGQRRQLKSSVPVPGRVDYFWCMMELRSCAGGHREVVSI